MSQSNYSSARQGIIEDGQTYIEDIELVQEVIMDEVYETFVISGVLSGLFNIPGFWEGKRRYLKHEWVAPPKKWIDPLKEATATKIALQTGQKTFQQIAAENGKDWKEQIDETVAVLDYARKKGMEMGGVIFGRTAAELNPAGSSREAVPGMPGGTDGGNQPATASSGQQEEKPDKGI